MNNFILQVGAAFNNVRTFPFNNIYLLRLYYYKLKNFLKIRLTTLHSNVQYGIDVESSDTYPAALYNVSP